MEMKSLIIIFGLIAVAQSLSDTTTAATYFCNQKPLCKKDTTPLACLFTESTDAWCDSTSIELNKLSLLKYHNDYRQQIASGDHQYYPTASRMAEIQWSDELELLAFYNLKRCKYERDQCLSTRKFRKGGQNMARKRWSSGSLNLLDEVKEMVDEWFSELDIADESYITEYHTPALLMKNFLQIVKDSATHVGCAASQYMEGDRHIFHLICNYARTNIVGEATYEIGAPASKCTERSSKYSALCSIY